jgi:hypothetical protein
VRSYEIFGRPRRPSRRADDLAVMRWGRQVTFDCQFAITTRLMRSDLNARAGNLQTSGNQNSAYDRGTVSHVSRAMDRSLVMRRVEIRLIQG